LPEKPEADGRALRRGEMAPGAAAEVPLVAVVVLHARGRSHTEGCLRSLAAPTYPHVCAILIENGSRDFTAAEVEQILPGTRFIRSEVNLGFTGGVNLGMRHAVDLGARYVLLLNNDTTVAPDAVSELVRVAEEDPRIGVVGAKVLQMDVPDRIESVGLRLNLIWGRVYQIGFGHRDRGQYDRVADVLAVSGAAMLLRPDVWKGVGELDDRYFLYFEDADLCVRVRQAGCRVVTAPRARVYHKGKGVSEGLTSPMCSYYATRNHLMIMRRYGRGKGLVALPRAAVIVALNAAYAMRRGSGTRIERLRAVWQGLCDYRRGAVGRH